MSIKDKLESFRRMFLAPKKDECGPRTSRVRSYEPTGENWDAMWNLHRSLLGRSPKTHGLAQVGLGLHSSPLTNERLYDTTPENTVTFASTGGDGVHFGLLVADGVVGDESPVIITYPLGTRTHVVAGETLREFLSIGAWVSFYGLESLGGDLQYRPRERGVRHAQGDRLDIGQRSVLAELRDHLDLKPVDDEFTRLETLQEAYLPLLDVTRA